MQANAPSSARRATSPMSHSEPHEDDPLSGDTGAHGPLPTSPCGSARLVTASRLGDVSQLSYLFRKSHRFVTQRLSGWRVDTIHRRKACGRSAGKQDDVRSSSRWCPGSDGNATRSSTPWGLRLSCDTCQTRVTRRHCIPQGELTCLRMFIRVRVTATKREHERTAGRSWASHCPQRGVGSSPANRTLWA